MKQVVQSASGGPVRVVEVPRPSIGATEVLVQTQASVISPGTERAVTELARSSLVAKARARPDLVRQVVRRARTEGVRSTARAVRTRLSADLALGYSAAGIVVEVGEAVADLMPGQLVATAGAGWACHAEYQAVPGLLCAPVPDRVAPGDAAFTTLGAIALHGLRLAEVGPGAKVVVIGLGLVGQLAVRLARAAGCDVAGIDHAPFPVERAGPSGALALVERGSETTAAILDWTRGRGADAVLVTAAGKSAAAVLRTPAVCRDRATVVVIGDVGLKLERGPLYEKELSLRFARSYGPGRYDRSYEEWGVDYPVGHVRWTEGRNLEAVLDLLHTGRLEVADLVTHRFDVADAARAYELIESRSEPHLGVALSYPATPESEQPVRFHTPTRTTTPGVGLIGAGAFASTVLVPAFRDAGFRHFVSVASASGLSAARLAERAEFEQAVSGADAVLSDPNVDVVVVATPHDTHAPLTIQALQAGKHVWSEKPLALTMQELDEVEAAWRASGSTLFVGFNRRWSPAITAVARHFEDRTEPLVISYRVSARPVPSDHWYHDRRHGGRLIGEVCHFIDSCAAIVGSDATGVRAIRSGDGAAVDDVAVLLGYADGSIASVTYCSGGPPWVAKEQIDVLSPGHSARVEDFRRVVLDRTTKASRQDKGHRGAAAAFLHAVTGDGPNPTPSALASMRSTLLGAHQPVVDEEPGRR